MLSFNQLLKYLRTHHSIDIKTNQTRALRNMGYYHGYKGYRFVRDKNHLIAFSSLDEIICLNKFDTDLKALFYPKVMSIETALKSYVIEAILADSGSEKLDDIFNNTLTAYRSYRFGSSNYHKQYANRMKLKGKINQALIRDYNNDVNTVTHFFNNDKSIPIWAIFESLSLGEFGTFFACSNYNVKHHTSVILSLPENLDSDGRITEYIIYTIKDLRNAIAHNNVIFDTRFRSGDIKQRLINLLQSETGINRIDFKYIDAYIILVTYVLRKMKVPKTECKQFITAYIAASEKLRLKLPDNICNQILGTEQRSHIESLFLFLKYS